MTSGTEAAQTESLVPTYRTAPIKLRFELEPRDLEVAVEFQSRRSRAFAALPFIGVVMMVGGAWTLVASGADGLASGGISLLIGAMGVGAPFVRRYAVRKQFRQTPVAQRAIEYELSEDRLRVKDGRGQMELPWNEVGGVGSDGHALYWWTRPELIHLIPVRAFQSPEAMRETVAFIERKCPEGAVRSRRGRTGFRVVVLAVWLVLVLMFVGVYWLVAPESNDAHWDEEYESDTYAPER